MEGVMDEMNGSLVVNKAGKNTMTGQPSKESIFGDLLWVKVHESSWWPAQVVDENSVSAGKKPSSRGSSSDVLVRLYGSYIYKYVDIHRSRAEFKNILIENNFNRDDILKKSLEQDLRGLNSNRSRRRQQSKSRGTVGTEASQNGSSEKGVSVKSEAKVSNKKRKQEKQKTAESHPETSEVKTKIKRPKLNRVHDVTRPSENDVSDKSEAKISNKKQTQEKPETAKSCPETSGIKTKSKRPKLDRVLNNTEPADKSEAKVSNKKRKQEKPETAKSCPETSEVKTKNKRPKLDRVHNDTEPSENGVSDKSEVLNKKRKQEKPKTAESHPETSEVKTKNKRQKLDGVHYNTEPSTPNVATLSPQELSARRMKVMQSLGLIAPSGSPFPRIRLISPTPTALT